MDVVRKTKLNAVVLQTDPRNARFAVFTSINSPFIKNS